MFERLLSFFGYLPGLSGLSGFNNSSSGEDGFESEGEARVSFQPGTKITGSEEEETADERRARLTDRDLVWPGKTETIQIRNPEPLAYRFDLTVTDLDGSFYLRRPAVGGVQLQPGEEATFEIVFVSPPAGEKTRTRTFSLVLTCFDPRRSADPGEIVQDLPLRWVALPTPSDLQISALPPLVVTRPWRREARFAVKFQNKSYLPPALGLTILRAPTKEALDRGGETVGTIEQSLAARTPGIWQCVLPPALRRGSYYATVRGAAQTAEAHSAPLALPRPIVVRYVPWLRMGRDWLFLLGLLLLLFWLAWGVPVRKVPIVRVSLAFAGLDKGQIPTDSRLQDLTAQLILTDERGHDLEGQTPILGVVLGNAFEFTAPTRWYGFRWFFGDHIGWNGFSRVPQHFRITLAPAESEKAAFKRYDLNTLLPDGVPAYDITTAEKPYGTWVTPATYVVQSAHGVFVNLYLGELGALAGKDLHRVSVAYALDGEEQAPRTFQLLHDGSGRLRPLTLDLTDALPLGTSKEFTVKVTAEGLSSYDAQPMEVHRQDQPFSMTLAFPKAFPKAATASVGEHPPLTATPVPSPSPQPSSTPGPALGPKPGGVLGPKLSPSPVPQPGAKPVKTSLPTSLSPHPTSMPRPSPPPAPASPPAAPDGLTAQVAGPTEIDVHWNRVADAEKYILYRSGGPGEGKSEKYLSADETAFSDTGLAPGTVYFYRVQAKRGSLYSPQSSRTAVLTRALTTVPVTVTLSLAQFGNDLHAVLNFANVSLQSVYLDKISACTDGKIGDDLFRVTADGQPVSFTGRRTKRRSNPGPRQFATLLPSESVHIDVVLSRAYRLLPGTHTYTVTYAGQHIYPAKMQSMTLQSNEASLVAVR